jgi:hypothetical protein
LIVRNFLFLFSASNDWVGIPQVTMNTDGSIRIRGNVYPIHVGGGNSNRCINNGKLAQYLNTSRLQHRIPLLLQKGYDIPTILQYAADMMGTPSITIDVLVKMAQCVGACNT